ncbi:MAG TPA: sugar MFS transporter [Chryseolinea sp.]
MSTQKSYALPMIIIGILFFVFGFVTWVNGTLITYLKIACELDTDLQSFLVTTAFFIAYFVMGIPSSWVLNVTGYKKGMALGLLIMAIGAIVFVPAAQARNFNMFLGGLFVIGTGLALLQTASNPYVSMIGPIESAAKRISIMGICNKSAGIIASLIFSEIALSNVDVLVAGLKSMDATAKDLELDQLASRVIVPYIIIAVVLAVLAVATLFSGLPDIKEEDEPTEGASSAASSKTSVFQFPHLILGLITMFLYVGCEVMAGDTIISYGKSLNIELSTARYFTIGTLTFMLLGYVVGIFAIPKYLTQAKALTICAVLGVIFTVLAVITPGIVSVGCIAALGLANSIMWPAIFPLAIDGVGKFIRTASALLVMSIVGGAVLPLVYGKLLQSWGSQHAYIMMLPCYLFILYFATKGYKAGKA